MSLPRFTVLGSSGFIGSNMLLYLHKQGYACASPSKGDEGIFHEPLGHVIYAIGLTADFRARPLDTVEAHVCLLRRLIGAGNFDSLTYLSSTRVYAGSTDTRETATLKVNPCDASDLYNLSKLMGESLCLHGGQPNIKVARLSNIVGLRSAPDIFIDQLLEEGYARGRVELRTSWSSRKDYLYIDDVVALLAAIALSPATGIFNVASGNGIENGEIAEFLERELDFRVSVAPDAPSWDFSPIDVTRIQTGFGFSPRNFHDYFPLFLRLHRQKRIVNELF